MDILLGAGSNRTRKLYVLGQEEWGDLVTVDHNADHNPDIVHDLMELPYPFKSDSADSISAFEVMEHLGQQGDWRWFFAQWSEIWRILKPGGMFFGTSPAPTSPWAFGDPSHTRIIGRECLTFLVQPEYEAQVGVTPMSDFRFVYKADFDILHSRITEQLQHHYILQAIKPSRITK